MQSLLISKIADKQIGRCDDALYWLYLA